MFNKTYDEVGNLSAVPFSNITMDPDSQQLFSYIIDSTMDILLSDEQQQQPPSSQQQQQRYKFGVVGKPYQNISYSPPRNCYYSELFSILVYITYFLFIMSIAFFLKTMISAKNKRKPQLPQLQASSPFVEKKIIKEKRSPEPEPVEMESLFYADNKPHPYKSTVL